MSWDSLAAARTAEQKRTASGEEATCGNCIPTLSAWNVRFIYQLLESRSIFEHMILTHFLWLVLGAVDGRVSTPDIGVRPHFKEFLIFNW